MKTAVVVPTLDAGKSWLKWIEAIKSQEEMLDKVLVIDSGSSDVTVSSAIKAKFEVQVIHNSDFNHGKTRQSAVDLLSDYEIIVFLTQDAILKGSDALGNMLKHFCDPGVAAVCGRQVPREMAGPIEVHARVYNYPAQSYTRVISDKMSYGLKTAFLSNSFAAYRVEALKGVGGFPSDVIFGEDMYVATRLLMAGYKIAYAADACVYHSHGYSLWQDMKRYFDMGVFHAREPWIRRELGGAEGEGAKFVVSELRYVSKHALWRVPEVLVRTLLRYSGFRLGLLENKLPFWLKRKLTMNKKYFKRK